ARRAASASALSRLRRLAPLLAAAPLACTAPTSAPLLDAATVDMRVVVDSAPDTVVDGPPDAAPDAIVDAAEDAIVDAGPDAILDAVPDALIDMAPDAVVDATPDAQVDRGPPREACAGGIDEDGDGLTDCEDPDCHLSPPCFAVRETCDNGRDDDGDQLTDCDDAYCLGEPVCPAPDVDPFDNAALQARFDIDCAGCHGPIEPFAGLDLSAPFAAVVVGVRSLEVPALDRVKAGDRKLSYLFLKVTKRHLEVNGEGEPMPIDHPWTSADAERLGRWIDGL
ncbi:MAG: hypothetical protein KC620_22950, partial [Myxococcales bacterium]|nr:hypothetical protein [Myxococcales bacterium]